VAGVGDEQDREVDGGEHAADEGGEGKADVDDPVEQGVGLDPVSGRDHVGDDRVHRRPVQLGDEPDGEHHRGDRPEIANQPEPGHRDRAAEQRHHQRDLAAEPVGQIAAGQRGGERPRAEHRDHAAGLAHAHVADLDQVDRQQWHDEAAEPVDQRSPPYVPVRARRHRGDLGDPAAHPIEHGGSVVHRSRDARLAESPCDYLL